MDEVPDCVWVATNSGTAPQPPALACRNQHAYRPGQYLVGWTGCTCDGMPHRGHLTWRCRECDDVRECGQPQPATRVPHGAADDADQR